MRIPCFDCGGCGWVIASRCCGRVYPSGECRGDCVEAEQVACETCGGTGELPVDAIADEPLEANDHMKEGG